MEIRLGYLGDHEEVLPTVARWYHDEWGHTAHARTVESTQARLRANLNRDTIPFSLVAMLGDVLIGSAELKYREMEDMFPEKEHWLGGVYIAPSYRGQGIASTIVEEIASQAPRYGVETLWLQTERLDGGLYTKLGWNPWRQVNNHGIEVLVMERALRA